MIEDLSHAAIEYDKIRGRRRIRVDERDFFRPHAGGPLDAYPRFDERGLDDVRTADEVRNEPALRPLVNLFRRPDLNDPTMIENRNSIGHRERFALIMGDEDKGKAERTLKRLELALHRLAQLEIERSQRLVEKQHFRTQDKSARKSDPLPLSAGKLAGLARLQSHELDQLERLDAEATTLGSVHAPNHEPVANVLQHVHVREESVVLEHGVDRAAIHRHALDCFAEDFDAAGGRLVKTADQSEARRLARAGRAKHGEKLARSDVEIDAIHRLHGAEVTFDPAKGDGARRRLTRRTQRHGRQALKRLAADARRRMKIQFFAH